VAVIDSGVDYTHPDLAANIWVNTREIPGNGIDDDGNGFIDDVRGWDFVQRDNTPTDPNGHGTHVAGTIAAVNNSFGATGVAYNAQIMPVRALDANGSGSSANIAAGIRYAANNGADVINLSLGGGFSSEIQSAIQYATQVGAMVVMASGNESQSQPSYPSRLANQYGIAVGAVDRNNKVASFSNGAGTSTLNYVVAPGVNVYSTTPNNTYRSFSGTSMATPHVAGVAALILSANPNLSPAEVTTLLAGTANRSGITV
jgi:subtilisin family serine protease